MTGGESSTGAPMVRIDLNGDVGEWDGAGPCPPRELLLMDQLTSVSVACGGHAGDEASMRETVVAARNRGLSIGAHPSFPDRTGFGRRPLPLGADRLRGILAGQIERLAGIAAAAGVRLAHVKPHGALYHAAATDPTVAATVADAVADVDPRLVVVGRSGGLLLAAAARRGLPRLSEVFCDRAYEADGGLVPRTLPGALLSDPAAATARLLGMLRRGTVDAIDGTPLDVVAETACIHGDTPGGAALAHAIRAGLRAAGITVAAPDAAASRSPGSGPA